MFGVYGNDFQILLKPSIVHDQSHMPFTKTFLGQGFNEAVLVGFQVKLT